METFILLEIDELNSVTTRNMAPLYTIDKEEPTGQSLGKSRSTAGSFIIKRAQVATDEKLVDIEMLGIKDGVVTFISKELIGVEK